MRYVLMVVVVITIAAAAALLPSRPYLDFQLIYHANLGLLRGISLYDHGGQVGLIAALAQVSPDRVYVLPFPYPPWYALSTLWLALLPIDQAARGWFAANLGMLALASWLLIRPQPVRMRLLFFLGGLFWLPVLGGLFVGQYGFPVLLGAALMVHALRKEDPILVSVGAALLTFKPHLGGPLLVMIAIHLALRQDRFGRRALLATAAAAVMLFAVGFLASPNWPLEYVRSLTGFRDVSQCGQCVSLPMAAAAVARGGFDQAIWIALIAGAALSGWLVSHWGRVIARPEVLVSVGILVTLLVSPYLQNYDYLLLLVPFLELAAIARRIAEWIVLSAAYVIPWISLGLWGTGGNNSLIVSAAILFALAATTLIAKTQEPASNVTA